MIKGGQQNYPKVIDYACGAGHFLTEAFEEIQKIAKKNSFESNFTWLKDKIFGIEKDYRLSRVSKIMLFMHGAGDGNIIFGDGLDSYPDKDVENETFDILVANPPYSVSAFKPHLRLKNNKDLNLIQLISNDGSEIETLFVERASQLLKPGGVAGIILPSSLLTKKSGSFVGAREILLKKFKIRAIVSMGKKTFGATGTPTIIMFLEKNLYPPKREDQVDDTVTAIFNASTIDDLNEWEDRKVIEEYCKQINVSLESYFSFINKKVDYIDYKEDIYFRRYYENLINSSEYRTKIKQKNFKKKSIEDQNKEVNKLFYDLSHTIEKDKVSIFAFVYWQKTLVVLAPDDNKEEQQFLGYSWSDRKGQEGIQIKKMGGKLFDDNYQEDKNKFDYLIHNCFNDKQFDSEMLQNYYFYSDLKDLIDFDSFTFDKIIKLVQKRKLKTDPEYKTYRLSDTNVFELNIGKRVLEEDLISPEIQNAIPVYSANVKDCFGYLNKSIVSDFSLPSVLWSIDGNWMVNYLDKNYKFYPTDHCGYLRVKTDDISPKYFMYALDVEGRFQRFNRNNRASMTALRSLVIQIPSLKTQTTIVNKLDDIDCKILALNKKIEDLKQSILMYIKDSFGNKKNNEVIQDWFDVEKGTTITEKEANEGDVPVVAGGTGPAYYHDTSNRPANVITVSASGSSGFVNFWNVPIFASDCNTIISKNEDEVSTIYLYYFLKLHQEEVYGLRKGLQPSHVYADDLKTFKFYKPTKNEKDNFLNFVKKVETTIKPIIKQVDEMKSEKNKIIYEHFIG